MCGNLRRNQDFGDVAIEIRKTTWPDGEKLSLARCKPKVDLPEQGQWVLHMPSSFKYLREK